MTRNSRRILIGLVFALTAVLAPAAVAQLPSIQVPGVSVPTVTTPSIQVPPIRVPQTPLQTPQVQVPSLQTPSLQTPQLQTPQLQTPQLQTPQLPGAQAPGVNIPSSPVTPGGTTPSTPGAPASPGSGLGAPGSTIARDGSIAAASPGQTRAGSKRSKRAKRAERRRRAARISEVRLRQAARRLSGCLDALPSFERRVIVLRTGIRSTPRTRRQVAKHLKVGVGRVRDAERSGIRGLRHADTDFGCGSAGGGALDFMGSSGTGGVGLAVASAGLIGSALTTLSSDSSGAAKDRNEVAGENKSSEEDESPVRLLPGAVPGGDMSLVQQVLLLTALALMALMSAVAVLRGCLRGTR